MTNLKLDLSGDHFKDKKGNVYDVHKLWKLSKDLPVKDVPVKNLEHFLLERRWRQPDDTKVIAAFNRDEWHENKVKYANMEYPIILSPEGRVMDGMHRIMHAYRTKNKTIKAVQFTEQPKEAIIKKGKDLEKPSKLNYFNGMNRFEKIALHPLIEASVAGAELGGLGGMMSAVPSHKPGKFKETMLDNWAVGGALGTAIAPLIYALHKKGIVGLRR